MSAEIEIQVAEIHVTMHQAVDEQHAVHALQYTPHDDTALFRASWCGANLSNGSMKSMASAPGPDASRNRGCRRCCWFYPPDAASRPGRAVPLYELIRSLVHWTLAPRTAAMAKCRHGANILLRRIGIGVAP